MKQGPGLLIEKEAPWAWAGVSVKDRDTKLNGSYWLRPQLFLMDATKLTTGIALRPLKEGIRKYIKVLLLFKFNTIYEWDLNLDLMIWEGLWKEFSNSMSSGESYRKDSLSTTELQGCNSLLHPNFVFPWTNSSPLSPSGSVCSTWLQVGWNLFLLSWIDLLWWENT